ncbi:MAG: type VI secretion system baseplate subunit TssK [Bryobacteraceae bacterium]
MKRLCGIAWSEGMYLAQHHFQAQARFFEDSLHFSVTSLWKCSHGFTEWVLDPASLRNGLVSIRHARGIFPDGLIFDISADDQIPGPLPIIDLFAPGMPFLTIFIGVPAYIEDGVNCELESRNGSSGVRQSAVPRSVTDHNTGKDSRTVHFGRSNLRLFAESEAVFGWVSLPLARIVRDGDGEFAYDESFIPPSLQVTSCESLSVLLQSLIEKLEQKSGDLSLTRKTPRRSMVGFAGRDIAGFWLLHTVNSALAALRHQLEKRAHPKETYLEMLRLAGALCTFNRDSNPDTLPLYDHDSPGTCFSALERRIRRDVDVLLPENVFVVPVVSAGNCFYEARISDRRTLSHSRWILSIRSSAPVSEVVRVPSLVKVCSRRFVPELVRRQVPGIKLIHLATLPPELVPQGQTEYFELRKEGPCWTSIVDTADLGVFVPAELTEPEMQLLIVQDSAEGLE